MKRRITFDKRDDSYVRAYDARVNYLGDYTINSILDILTKSQKVKFSKLLSGEVDGIVLTLEEI